jgi:hypothetical protein
MKRTFLPVAVAITLLVFTNFKCEKENSSNKLSGCIKGKLIIKGPCAQFVVQVVGGDTANIATEKTWNDPETGNSYNNVFTVKNYCNFSAPAVGDEFWFYAIRQEKTMECIICMAARATPSVTNEIESSGNTCP